MNRILPKNHNILILSGVVTLGLAILVVKLGYIILDSSDMPKFLFVLINCAGLVLCWYFLSFLLHRYPVYKVLSLVGLLVLSVLAERYIAIGDNPITIPLIILFWLGLTYFILPQFFKKYQLVILSVYGLVIAYYFFNFLITPDYGQVDRERFARYMLMPIPIFAILWFYEQWRWVRILKADKTKAELTVLKSQVNPHFFFNTLNNLYGLVVEKSPEAPQVVLGLSDMMRYTIAMGNEELVKLTDEIHYLESYISLHKIRYRNNVDIQFTHDVNKDIEVAPLLFINLLENAFKHGVESLTENAYIHINLKTETNQLLFSIENNYEANASSQKAGTGLDNLKKRLVHSYPKRHSLTIDKTDTCYAANLKLVVNPKTNK